MQEEFKNYFEAARVAGSIADVARSLVKPGESLLKVAEAIEKEIVAGGGKPAFPVNLSINDEAAHRTPSLEDKSVFGEKDVVKVDFGVHVEGSIIDTAITIDLSQENAKLVEASEKALENALSVMKAGVSVKTVGAEIEKTIRDAGFKPIENLCGHSLDTYFLHAGEEIPNTGRGSYVLEEGDVFAVEPFATTGGGRVIDSSPPAEIFSMLQPKNVRLPSSRKLIELAMSEYNLLPFAKRWLSKAFVSEPSLNLALSDLVRQNILHPYRILKEINAGLVSQAETTVIVEKDSVKALV
ncbi:MAG: type II methionyl aminopeptidase [Candidatus Micrarchaeota archaeon]